MDRSGQLEVEVIEARGLTPKPGSKSLPGEAAQLGEVRKGLGRDGVLASKSSAHQCPKAVLWTVSHTLPGWKVGEQAGPAHPTPHQNHLEGGGRLWHLSQPCAFIFSHLYQGLPAGERGMCSQEKNEGGQEDL